MELSDTVVYLKVVKQSNCIELLACGVFLKNERKILNGTHFCYQTIRWIEKLVSLCTDNMSRLVVLPVHMKPPKKVLSIILSLQQAR